MPENDSSHRSEALAIVAEQIGEATAAKKCHACGCFHSAVAAFEQTDAGRHELGLQGPSAEGELLSG